jgi:hypothetical protein
MKDTGKLQPNAEESRNLETAAELAEKFASVPEADGARLDIVMLAACVLVVYCAEQAQFTRREFEEFLISEVVTLLDSAKGVPNA